MKDRAWMVSNISHDSVVPSRAEIEDLLATTGILPPQYDVFVPSLKFTSDAGKHDFLRKLTKQKFPPRRVFLPGRFLGDQQGIQFEVLATNGFNDNCFENLSEFVWILGEDEIGYELQEFDLTALTSQNAGVVLNCSKKFGRKGEQLNKGGAAYNLFCHRNWLGSFSGLLLRRKVFMEVLKLKGGVLEPRYAWVYWAFVFEHGHLLVGSVSELEPITETFSDPIDVALALTLVNRTPVNGQSTKNDVCLRNIDMNVDGEEILKLVTECESILSSGEKRIPA